MDYDSSSGRRNKGKEKKREKKKHPYQKGGKYRSDNISLTGKNN